MGVLILVVVLLIFKLVGMDRFLSSVWNAILQDPIVTTTTTTTVTTTTIRGIKGYQPEQHPQVVQPDDPEQIRPRRKKRPPRRIKRSLKQREQLHTMKERFQQLQGNDTSTSTGTNTHTNNEKDGNLLQCWHWPTAVGPPAPSLLGVVVTTGHDERNVEHLPLPKVSSSTSTTPPPPLPLLKQCIPLPPKQPKQERGWKGFLFGSGATEKSLEQRRFVIRNTLSHDRILSCPTTSSRSNNNNNKDNKKNRIIVVPANGGIYELNGQQLQDCQTVRPRLFVQTPIASSTTTTNNNNSNNNNNNSSNNSNDHQDSSPPTIVNKKHVPPIVALWNGADPDDAKPFANCSVPCSSAGRYAILSFIDIADTPWAITQSMEGPAYYSQTKIYPQAYFQWDQYYATTSFQSEIPMPYFSWAEYDISPGQTHPVNFDTALPAASFLANNCNSQSNREQVVMQLMELQEPPKNSGSGIGGLPIHALSGCLHNAELPLGIYDRSNKTAILEKYLFHLALENQNYDDYITEKVWGALEAGTLPVYMGAPNIKDHVPPHSIIVVDDFASLDDLSRYLMKLSKDRNLYNEYHAWRLQPTLDAHFYQKYQFTHVHSTCRICKWAFAKRYGWGWSHVQQEIVAPLIARRTCRNKLGLVGHPFKEYWLLTSSLTASRNSEEDTAGVGGGAGRYHPIPAIVESEGSEKTCALDDSNRVLWIGSDKRLSRTVYHQDGVTDFVISYHPPTKMDTSGEINGDWDASSSSLSWILKLETPIRTTELRVVDGRQSLLQDEQSRITLLTSHEVPLPKRLDQSGTIELPITLPPTATAKEQHQPQDPIVVFQIRIIVEELDLFHQGATNRVNYYGKLLTQDFFNPLEIYEIVPS
jgi:hypothetical protein